MNICTLSDFPAVPAVLIVSVTGNATLHLAPTYAAAEAYKELRDQNPTVHSSVVLTITPSLVNLERYALVAAQVPNN